MSSKQRLPAVEGWFAESPEPHLIGSRCTTCGTVFFPQTSFFCRNPDCDGTSFEPTALSRTGTLWSYTDAAYQPPPPYIPATDPYQPFSIAAVELAEEQMVVLGQVADGWHAEDLRVGMTMELVIDRLFADDEHEYLTWKWQPIGGTR
jgi:hypothetical protein